MSSGSRWTIAIFCLIWVVAFLALPFWMPEAGVSITRPGLWAVIAFLLLIVITCFPGPCRRVAARIIGAIIFVCCVTYVWSEWGKPFDLLYYLLHYRRSDTNIVNALIAFFLFGVPSAFVAWTGQFPKWTILVDQLHPAPTDLEEVADDEDWTNSGP